MPRRYKNSDKNLFSIINKKYLEKSAVINLRLRLHSHSFKFSYIFSLGSSKPSDSFKTFKSLNLKSFVFEKIEIKLKKLSLKKRSLQLSKEQ